MFKLLYLPTGEYVNKYLEHVKDTFKTYEEAEQAIEENRVVYNEDDFETPLFLNSMYLDKNSLGTVKHHLLEIIELPDV
jgi:hypothetical protein